MADGSSRLDSFPAPGQLSGTNCLAHCTAAWPRYPHRPWIQHSVVRLRSEWTIHRTRAFPPLPAERSHDLGRRREQGVRQSPRTHEMGRSSFHCATLLAVSLLDSLRLDDKLMACPSWFHAQACKTTSYPGCGRVNWNSLPGFRSKSKTETFRPVLARTRKIHGWINRDPRFARER